MIDLDDGSQDPGKKNQPEIPIGLLRKCKVYYVTASSFETPCLQ